MGLIEDNKERELTMWLVAPMSMIQVGEEEAEKLEGLPER